MLIICSRSQLKGSYLATESESNSAECCVVLIGGASVTRTERGVQEWARTVHGLA